MRLPRLLLSLGIVCATQTWAGVSVQNINCSSHGLYNSFGPLETELSVSAQMDPQGGLSNLILTLDRQEVFNQRFVSATGRDSAQRWNYDLGISGHGSWANDHFSIQLPRLAQKRDQVDGHINVTLEDGEKFEGTLSCH